MTCLLLAALLLIASSAQIAAHVCSIGEASVMEEIVAYHKNSTAVSDEIMTFLKAWHPPTAQEVKNRSAIPAQVLRNEGHNIGGNQMYHSYGLWVRQL